MRICDVDGCDLPHKGHGFCEKHLNRFRRYGDPLGGGTFRYKRPDQCAVDGCDKPVAGRGLCAMHHRRVSLYGDPDGGKFHQDAARRRWHEGDRGYVVRYDPENPNAGQNGYVYQHRHVMAELIGRPLRSEENVHHKNGVRSDNTLNNLELWITPQPAGQRVEDQISWALKILADYGGVYEKLRTLAA